MTSTFMNKLFRKKAIDFNDDKIEKTDKLSTLSLVSMG